MLTNRMEFKYKSYKGSTWDTTGLERVLKMYYPGATTISEAISMAKQQLPSKEAQDRFIEATKIEMEQGYKQIMTQPEPSSDEPSPTQMKPKPRLPYADTDEEF